MNNKIKQIFTNKYIKNEPIFNPETKNNFVSNIIGCIIFMTISIIVEIVLIIFCFCIYKQLSLNIIILFILITFFNYLFFMMGVAIIDNSIKHYKNIRNIKNNKKITYLNLLFNYNML